MLIEMYREKQISIKQCTGCEACAQICTAKAIVMKENEEGFLYPIINNEKCIKCGQCVSVCPVLSTNHQIITHQTELYSGYEKSLKYQKYCSSGGIFGLIAEHILQIGGIVFGAVYDPSTKSVVHVSSDEVSIENIFRSKYVQSRIGKTYTKIKEILVSTERKVLFCGTPCQIEGLKKFLKKEYKNLITVDFVCHGVPSPGVFREVLQAEEIKNKGTIKDVTFREKNPNGKGEEYLYLYLTDGRKVGYKSLNYYYYYLFLYNCILRSSCMNCKRAENHIADLTLADDWLQKWQNNSEIGVSLIQVNTEKGKNIFDSLRSELVIQLVDPTTRKIITQAHKYSIKDRKRVFQKYRYKHDVKILNREFQKIRFRNESKKQLIYILSKCYRTIVPRRKDNEKK